MSVDAALKAARNLIEFRGWAPGHSWEPAVGPYAGARPERGPVSMTSALADTPGDVFRSAYLRLLKATGAASLTVWEGDPERTQADVLAVFDR